MSFLPEEFEKDGLCGETRQMLTISPHGILIQIIHKSEDTYSEEVRFDTSFQEEEKQIHVATC